MSNVVKKCCQTSHLAKSISRRSRGKIEIFKDSIEKTSGHMGNAQRVDVSVVGGTWKAELGKSQLLDGPKTLVSRRIQDRHFRIIEFNGPMDRIANFHSILVLCAKLGVKGSLQTGLERIRKQAFSHWKSRPMMGPNSRRRNE